MRLFKILVLTFLYSPILHECYSQNLDKINGISLESPPVPFEINQFEILSETGANWVAIIPYGYSTKGDPMVYYNSSRQWWGERPEGIRQMIKMAKAKGFNVMLKPQVWMPNSWVGEFTCDNDADWKVWETTYSEYVLTFARIAQEEEVKLFCIGTEYRIASSVRSAFWKQLIREVRKHFSGKITYAANWDEYQNVAFWDQLDYIGIDAYFPLSESVLATTADLEEAWKPIKKDIKVVSTALNIPILFTEFGYRSVEQNAGNQWEIKNNPICMSCQSIAYQAIFNSFWKEEFVAGGFIWKWHLVDEIDAEANRNYTPQGKPALKIIRNFFKSIKK